MANSQTKPADTDKPAGNDGQTPDKTEGGMSLDQAVKLVGGSVRVPARDKRGKPIVEKGVYQMEKRKLAPEHVLSFKEHDNRVVVVTVDGQKLIALHTRKK